MKIYALTACIFLCKLSFAADHKSRIGEAAYVDSFFNPIFTRTPSDSPMKPPRYIVSEELGVVGYIDNAAKARFCRQDEKYYCVESQHLTFAFPKGGPSQDWTYNGVKYRLLGKLEFEVLDRKLSVWNIQSSGKKKGVDNQYYFSVDYGLLAFGHVDQDRQTTEMYWSEDVCGFAGDASKCD